MRKNILIIGGSSGIGLELIKLIEEENNVFAACRTNDHMTDLNVTHIPFDVLTDTLDLSLLPESLDGFVYCPGSINLRPFKGLKPENFLNDFSINVMGAVKTLQSILSKLQSGDVTASVVFYSTVAVQTGMAYHASVAAAKGALEGMARSLAAELAPKVRVNVIAPSITNTPLADKFLNNDTKKENAAGRHPLQRFGSAKEMAEATEFLLSDKSSWMTAQILHIDGGIGDIKS
jgi:NAD(P)-dependent dehydrogenase (short-subunit alcohol dehydrogenase family)